MPRTSATPDTLTRLELAEVFSKAVNWLDANPDKKLTGTLARTATNDYCSTLSPDACCFCVLGRVAVELGIDTMDTGEVGGVLVDGGLLTGPEEAWDANDAFPGVEKLLDVERRVRQRADYAPENKCAVGSMLFERFWS